MWWTLAASVIASGTALIIAFFAYPRQKEIDRNNELRREQRDAYRRFFRQTVSVSDVFSRVDFHGLDGMKSSLNRAMLARDEYEAALRELAITASQNVLSAAAETHRIIYEAMEEWADSEGTLREEFPEGIPTEALKTGIMHVALEKRAKFLKAEHALGKMIRAEEFGDDVVFEVAPRTVSGPEEGPSK